MPLLFSYGTLQDERVQLELFGRRLAGRKDELLGYAQTRVQVADPAFARTSGKAEHPMLRPAADPLAAVAGMAFDVTEVELERADAYEPAEYRRVLAPLASGAQAWVYVAAPQTANGHGGDPHMDIESFMQGYKQAWEARDPAMFARLFADNGEYHNTPFAVQVGHAQLREYWHRVTLQEDVQLSYDVLATSAAGGIAHWHVTYQVASEELFQIWARSTGTNLVARKPGDPLPRMVLDGVLQAEFVAGGCRRCRLWWHSMPQPA